MKNIIAITLCTGVFSFAAFAQTMPAVREHNGSMPSAPSHSSTSQSSDSLNSGNQSTANIGLKRLKGCLLAEGGKYMLQERRGKEISLTGSSELGSHVGHMVTVVGTSIGADNRTSMNSNRTSAGGSFAVSKLDMIADNCGSDKKQSVEPVNSNGKPSPYHTK